MGVPALLMPAILLSTGLCFGAMPTEIPASYHRPVQVELVNYLDVRRLHAGSSFFVKVSSDWSGLGCYFRQGQLVEGRVTQAIRRSKASSLSQLAVSFANVPCLYGKSSLDLVLAAAVSPAGESSNLPHAQFPIVRYSPGTYGLQGNFVISGIEMMALNGKPGQSGIQPGDVIGIKALTLRIGSGPAESSILESSTRNVFLERETQFLLVPSSIAMLHSSPPGAGVDLSPERTAAPEASETLSVNTASPEAPAPLESVQPLRQDFLACAPPACNVDLPQMSREDAPGKAMLSVGIRPLGYAPRAQSEIDGLNDDDAVAWLGSHQFIVAFNTHPLVRRENPASTDATLRRIHAAVFDLTSQKVVSTADLDLPDEGAYLWQLSENRVLVHAGNELRVLSGDLKVETRIPLEGPLAFVRISPNREWMAIAVIHERHPPELHAKLRESFGSEPEEDVQMRILDKNFRTVAQAASTSKMMPPILLNEGQARLSVNGEGHYQLTMLPWRGGTASVARFGSACLPSVSSFAPDLLFVTTCAPLSGIHEYRVLRPNGEVLMRGKSDPQDLGQEVVGTSEKFAIKLIHARRAVVEGSVFRGADLDYTEVRVYRSGDGRRLTAVRIDAPSPGHGGFALSSDGSQLAILSGSRVSLFSVP
jgi:hypothetical protein